MASEVWFSLVKIVWKMHQFHQNKQWRKLRKGSYNPTDNLEKAVIFSNDTAIVTCASNYAGAALESFIKWWSEADKKKTNVSKAHANRRDGVVVRASASQSVDLGFIP